MQYKLLQEMPFDTVDRPWRKCRLCRDMDIDTASDYWWSCPMLGEDICETHCCEIRLGCIPEQLDLIYKGDMLCANCPHF